MTKKEIDAAAKVKRVAASMAIEDMYLNKDFIKQMIKVADGTLSSEQVRQEVIKQYAGQ